MLGATPIQQPRPEAHSQETESNRNGRLLNCTSRPDSASTELRHKSASKLERLD